MILYVCVYKCIIFTHTPVLQGPVLKHNLFILFYGRLLLLLKTYTYILLYAYV